MKKRKNTIITPIPMSAIILIAVLILSAIISAEICRRNADPMASVKIAAKLSIILSCLSGGITLKISGGNKNELLILTGAVTALLLCAECVGGITVTGMIMLPAAFISVISGYFLMSAKKKKRKHER